MNYDVTYTLNDSQFLLVFYELHGIETFQFSLMNYNLKNRVEIHKLSLVYETSTQSQCQEGAGNRENLSIDSNLSPSDLLGFSLNRA